MMPFVPRGALVVEKAGISLCLAPGVATRSATWRMVDVVALATLVFLFEEQLQGRASGGHRGAPD